jgi:hypothetical protein
VRAAGGIRTPNLLIRRKIKGVQTGPHPSPDLLLNDCAIRAGPWLSRAVVSTSVSKSGRAAWLWVAASCHFFLSRFSRSCLFVGRSGAGQGSAEPIASATPQAPLTRSVEAGDWPRRGRRRPSPTRPFHYLTPLDAKLPARPRSRAPFPAQNGSGCASGEPPRRGVVAVLLGRTGSGLRQPSASRGQADPDRKAPPRPRTEMARGVLRCAEPAACPRAVSDTPM